MARPLSDPDSRGSSPRVRGTRSTWYWPVLSRRFIPACAGNTKLAGARDGHPAVHPRVFGEHTGAVADQQDNYGSSPRVRGTPYCPYGDAGDRRFIPACAGNTRSCSAPHACPPVHPRVCGEHLRRPFSSSSICGSSPRVRGTLVSGLQHGLGGRFIPACAGNTCR